jgi:putative FmdB family regulatory protein
MPIYEYKCRECELVFEVLKRSRSSEDEPEQCPDCGGDNTDKLFSSFAGMVPVAAGGGGCPSAGGGGCPGRSGGFS